ncbi:MAG: hypothetical protein IJ085_07605 [Turicibacter sp.]|nr:hypothetical protein [Turicibacter sp.]
MSKQRKWTEKEILFLKENFSNMTDKELGEALNRSKGSIERKREQLNLYKSKMNFKVTSEIEEEIINSDLPRADAIKFFSKKYPLSKNQIEYIFKKNGIKSDCNKKWTNEEIEFIIDTHGELSVGEVASILKRSPTSVYKKKFKLGLRTDKNLTFNKAERNWTDEELYFLKNNIDRLSYDEIAKHLNRTSKAVQVKAIKSKLVRYSSRWTQAQENLLIEYQHLPIYTLSFLLERTTRSIEHRAKELGLKIGYREKMTRIEKMIAEILDELNCEYSMYEKLGTDFLYEADFVLGNIVIEANGDYWHGNEKVFSQLDEIQTLAHIKDKIKKEYFESLGYEVHYIWEYDLYNDYENTKKDIAVLVQKSLKN